MKHLVLNLHTMLDLSLIHIFILNILQKLKKDNKYIILTTHDDFLIEHLDIVYEIKNKQLHCHQEIKEVQQVLKIEKTKHQRIKKYFFYKNQRQWFQFTETPCQRGKIFKIISLFS